ncbi:Isochorismatase family protein [Polystyrenella longa]|uniref:Isochorismatase family protein n=1 Tax=Polystyrenella longa TaxID=2528007 RepID=A0A518CLV2_9PLAN|nr:isochorismatase family protein [Polystyrenella longa]QDU80197.1 Isochorismatase family protein [Polystyrenella longa]
MTSHRSIYFCLLLLTLVSPSFAEEKSSDVRTYQNKLTLLENPEPLLNDYPEFIAPVKELNRYQAPLLVNDPGADLSVRAWRFSYNARGIIEVPNNIRLDQTAVIMVHPWGIDDGQGWTTPEPAGVADFCTPEKNHLAARHTREVINPFLKRMRGKAGFIMYSIIGDVDPLRKKMYRTFDENPTKEEREVARAAVLKKLAEFKYEGELIPQEITLSSETPVIDYFKQFPGIDSGPRYNGAGFWELPVPVTSDVTVEHDDVLIFDREGYKPLKEFLKANGIRHILLTGYATDMCFCKTTAGYENLSRDFNVFLVGDASLATFPANDTPRHATNAHISYAALNQLVTQVSWIKEIDSGVEPKVSQK